MLRPISFIAAIALCAAPLTAMAHSFHSVRAHAEHACAAMGLNPSEAPFTQCVMSLEASAGLTPAPPHGDYVAQRYSYQRGDQMTSIRRACGQTGAGCFGNLNMTIDDANRVGTD
jgi:hypothetical protein